MTIGKPCDLWSKSHPVDVKNSIKFARMSRALGWAREQLAFVLKVSVVGERKMEHGTTPIKSLESCNLHFSYSWLPYFSYSWLPLAEAAKAVCGGQGDWLHKVLV